MLVILLIILCIPIYGFLIYFYLFPEESNIKRWLYGDEAALSDKNIRNLKGISVIGMIVMTAILAMSISNLF